MVRPNKTVVKTLEMMPPPFFPLHFHTLGHHKHQTSLGQMNFYVLGGKDVQVLAERQKEAAVLTKCLIGQQCVLKF